MGFLRRASDALAVVRTYRNPLLRASDYYSLAEPGRKPLVHLRNGLRFRVRLGTSDFGVLDDVFIRGVYDQALQNIGRGDVVIDIGAQCGAFAVAAAARDARVFCYEPLPENGTLLQENARLNGYAERVTLEESAVAAQAGRKTLYVVRGDTGGATFFPAIHPEWSDGRMTTLSVRCVTLGEIFRTCGIEQCGCLKLDCEGAEYEILAAANVGDLEKTRMIVLEYHPNGDVAAIGDRLRKSGFAVQISPHPCILLARRPA